MLKGSIRKRGDKYQVLFSYKNEYGEWKQRSKTCSSMTHAKAQLKKFNYEQDSIKMDNPKFSEIVNMWIDEKSLKASSNTIKTYRSNSDFILQRLSDIGIKDYKRSDFVKLYKDISEEGYEVRAYKGVVNMIFGYSKRLGLIAINPAEGIGIERTEEKKDATMFSQRERIQMLKDQEGTRYHYMIFFIFKTGLRIGELLGLDWKNIDLDNAEIKIAQQMLSDGSITNRLKSKNSYRTVTIDTETVAKIREFSMSPFNDGDLLFKNTNYRTRLNARLWKYAATAHDLRHNHGTDLLRITTIADAATRMGHTVEEYVKTYVHPTDEEQKKIADKLGTDEYSLCDRFLTEQGGKVINMADTNVSKR